MSLYCVMCGKVIRMSDSPTHYGVCDDCPINKLTEEQKKKIEATQLAGVDTLKQFKAIMLDMQNHGILNGVDLEGYQGGRPTLTDSFVNVVNKSYPIFKKKKLERMAVDKEFAAEYRDASMADGAIMMSLVALMGSIHESQIDPYGLCLLLLAENECERFDEEIKNELIKSNRYRPAAKIVEERKEYESRNEWK